jgi:hypothetical protein
MAALRAAATDSRQWVACRALRRSLPTEHSRRPSVPQVAAGSEPFGSRLTHPPE